MKLLLVLTNLLIFTAASAWTPGPLSQSAQSLNFLTATVSESRRKRLATRRFSSESSTVEVDKKSEVKQQDVTPAAPVPAVNDVAPPKEAFLSLPTLASVLGATVFTFVLNNHLNLGPVCASSIAGLVSTLILPEKLALAAFCGSFAGMAKEAVIPGIAASGVLGLVCAGMIALFDRQKWLVGVGGRLGFIAQCACTTQFLVSSLFWAPTAPAALVGNTPLNFGALARQLPMVSCFTVLGALAMRYWKVLVGGKSKRLPNSVGAVSVVGLLAGLALPATMAGPVFCGSFVAMASPARLPNLASLVWASLLAAAAQQSLAGVLLGGWGGKLGTAALMGVLAPMAFSRKPAETKVAKAN